MRIRLHPATFDIDLGIAAHETTLHNTIVRTNARRPLADKSQIRVIIVPSDSKPDNSIGCRRLRRRLYASTRAPFERADPNSGDHRQTETSDAVVGPPETTRPQTACTGFSLSKITVIR